MLKRTEPLKLDGRRVKQIPYEKIETKKDTKKTVKMSRLCKAGLFFLR